MLSVFTITKKTAIEYIQKKIRKILMCLTIKINQTQNKTVMQEMRDKKKKKKAIKYTENKQHNDRGKCLPVTNCFKHK